MQANILLNCSKQTGSGPINKNPHSVLCFTVGILLFTMISRRILILIQSDPHFLLISIGIFCSHLFPAVIISKYKIKVQSKIECLFCTVLYFFTITSITYLQLLFQILPLNQQNDLVHTLHTLFSMQHSRPNQSVSLSSNTCSNVSLKSFLIRS